MVVSVGAFCTPIRWKTALSALANEASTASRNAIRLAQGAR